MEQSINVQFKKEKLMKSLDHLPSGRKAVIQSLEGGGRFLSRITAMGFTPETPVSVIRNGLGGPLIVGIRDTEVAIGRGEAAKIKIKEAAE